MIVWALPAAMVVVGLLTDWSPVRLVDTCWLYNSIVIGLALLLLWRRIPFNVQGWKVGVIFAFTVIWPIARVYFIGATA